MFISIVTKMKLLNEFFFKNSMHRMYLQAFSQYFKTSKKKKKKWK